MDTASKQLALALFEDLAPNGGIVQEAPTALGFRRSNAFVKITDLSAAGRRLVDITYFLIAEEAELRKEYRVDFGLFKWLLATTSNNRQHLRKLIREAQQAAIVLSEEDVGEGTKERWGSVPLLGAAFIEDNEYIFEVSDRLQRAIKNPAASHFLSLRYVFKSVHAKILHDRLQVHVDQGVTEWIELDELRVWLECAEKETYKTWKHFRQKVLDIAIEQIKEVTGLKITMLTLNEPGSKKIAKVRFRIETSEHPTSHNAALAVLRSLYHTLHKEMGLTKEELNEIISKREIYNDERINRAIEYTRHNVALGKVKLRAGGYFMKALREEYILGELDKQIHHQAAYTQSAKMFASQRENERIQKAAAEAEERARQIAQEGWAGFELLDADSQATLTREFCINPSAKLLARQADVSLAELQNNLRHPKVRDSFGTFVATWLRKKVKSPKQGGDSGNLFVGE